ncbi:flavin reductase family protein [Lacinutrix algicola]|uniref:flavin reductase family protein n=1 Tax=Lacinutrix algicola TaxID=342954 RepID=UPI0006E2AC1D|nr:flavin reductase [Lacinutrix algicola]
MPYFSLEDINNLQHLYKINLINSCSGFKSANLIGTKSKEGIENVAVFSSVTHVGSNPPILSFFCRPTTVTRDTYKNIKETGIYTINHIHESNFKEAHHTSAKYYSDISEFDKTNLISEYKENCFAPFVKHSPIQMEMKFVGEYNIKENGTILVLGEIQGLYINEDIVTDDGFVNLSEANVAAINGLDGYTFPKLKERLEYQRPK